MYKLFLSFVLLFGLLLLAVPVGAEAKATGAVISRVLVGDADSASDEFVEIENNSDQPINVTGWCVVYTNANETSKKMIGCLTAPDLATAVMAPPGGTAVFVSTKLVAKLNLAASQYTATFSGGMADSGGHVYLIPNSSGDTRQAVDEVDWGMSTSVAAGELPAGDLLTRQVIDGKYQDTDDNNLDFMFAPADSMQYQATTYLQPDLCLNDDGIQTEVPPGDILDNQGNCSPPPVDVCLNIDGVQSAPPPSATVDGAGNCLLDICPNLEGEQPVLPDGMIFDQTCACVLTTSAPPSSTSPDEGDQSDAPGDTTPPDNQPPSAGSTSDTPPVSTDDGLIVNELLPNPSGSDTGNEFIELFNGGSQTVHLSDYKLQIMSSSATTNVTLPNLTIAAGDYLALYNDALNFTLVNTTGQVGLVRLSDGKIISQSNVYQVAGDGMAWALIKGEWQYTNVPTPNAANLSSVTVLLASDVSAVKPCAANQYRNPETNRCRLIAVATTPTPCKDGQYRSEETGRCRSIAADANAVTPCGAGEERNPDTNRCRKIVAATAGTLKPCKAGQERNPDTNRCRAVKTMPDADYSVLAAKTTKSVSYVWWIVAAVVVGASAYAVWEWHEEILTRLKRLAALVKFKR